jgi:hypothetical protein
MSPHGRSGTDPGFTVYKDKPKTNGGGPAGTTGLSIEEKLVAEVIANPKLVPVVTKIGLQEAHFPQEAGLRGAFQYAPKGRAWIKKLLEKGYRGATFEMLEHLVDLGIDKTHCNCGLLRVTASKANSVTCNGPWHKEGVRVTGKGIPGSPPRAPRSSLRQFPRARSCACCGCPSGGRASLMSLLVHVFRLFCLFCLFSKSGLCLSLKFRRAKIHPGSGAWQSERQGVENWPGRFATAARSTTHIAIICACPHCRTLEESAVELDGRIMADPAHTMPNVYVLFCKSA